MPAEQPVLRTPVWVVLLRIAPVVVGFGLLSLLGVLTGDGAGFAPVVAALLGGTVGVTLVARMKVVLSPERLIVRGWRQWDLSWSEVQAVAPPPRGWFRTRSVSVYDGRGWRPLRALTVSWPWESARVEQQYHQVGQWWLAHRGADWRPAPPDQPLWLANPYASPPAG